MSDVTASPETLARLSAKGHEVFLGLQQSLISRSKSASEIPIFNDKYSTTIRSLEEDLPLSDWTFAAIEQIGHPITGYMSHGVKGVIPDDVKEVIPQEVPIQTPDPYSNFIHKDGKVILCMFNFASHDSNRGTPHALKWTDMMTAACAEVMQSTNGQADNLEAV